MTTWIAGWAIAAVIFLAVDLAWLLWAGRGLYVAEIGGLLKPAPNMAAAAAFYIIYITGLVFFVIMPAPASGSSVQVLLHGALFGLVAYGTYDLTNLAVMKGFTARIAVIDLAWGTVLTAVTAALTHWMVRLMPS